MKLADEININLVSYLERAGQLFPVPNYYIGRYECDVFSTTKSGITVEYEIKISVADYKNDFNKDNSGSWAVRTGRGIKLNKHDLIKKGQRTAKFYFVTPTALLDKNELPAYVGLIEWQLSPYHYMHFVTIKKAPLLHKRLVDYSKSVPIGIANAFYYRYKHYKYKLAKIKRSSGV